MLCFIYCLIYLYLLICFIFYSFLFFPFFRFSVPYPDIPKRPRAINISTASPRIGEKSFSNLRLIKTSRNSEGAGHFPDGEREKCSFAPRLKTAGSRALMDAGPGYCIPVFFAVLSRLWVTLLFLAKWRG